MTITAQQAADNGFIRCILDGARGIYIPQAFATGSHFRHDGHDDGWYDVDKQDIELLAEGPLSYDGSRETDLFYWETWDEVLESARYVDESGHRWRLMQEGDLFAVRDDIDIDWDDWI